MRTRFALVLAVAGIVIPAASLGPAAHARGAAEPPVSVVGGVTITGNGFGHGRGMSQYGAQGAATAGLNADQIMALYYPGTTKGSFAGRVRVLVTKDADTNLVVRPAAGLSLTDLGDATTYRLPTSTATGMVKRWRLSLYGGKTRVAYLSADGIWRVHRPAGKDVLVGGGEFKATGNLLSLLVGGVDHRYRGSLRFTKAMTVNVVGIDGYLRGVVPSEMPTSWQTEALRAQAIAARTYAAFERAENVNDTYQLFDDTRSQVYKGYDAEVASTNAAVVATAAKIRLSGGQPAFTQFSASNGGWSVDGGRSYLVAKADKYDGAYRHWTKPLDTQALERARPAIGTLQSITVLTRDGHGEWGGRVLTLRLNGSKATALLEGTDFRTILGLRSNWFKLS